MTLAFTKIMVAGRAITLMRQVGQDATHGLILVTPNRTHRIARAMTRSVDAGLAVSGNGVHGRGEDHGGRGLTTVALAKAETRHGIAKKKG